MKVIFLDIDGVMVTWHSKVSDKHENMAFDDNAVENLKHIIEHTGAKIILSSTWRVGRTLRYTKHKIFSHYGLDEYLIDQTPFNGFEVERGTEIREWLQNNDVDSFVIIDDDGDMCELINSLVRTSAVYGLTKQLAERCISILNSVDKSK